VRQPSPSDLTDEQWAFIQPLLPPAKSGGRPRTVNLREILNTPFCQARTGCQWDFLPHDLGPKGTADDYSYFSLWPTRGRSLGPLPS
jgi:putative transposase